MVLDPAGGELAWDCIKARRLLIGLDPAPHLLMHHLGMRERTNFGRGCSFSFLWLRKNYSGMKRNGQGQIKMCRRKQHVKIGSVKGVPNLFCGKFAVGGNYNLTRNNVDGDGGI